MCHTLPVLVEIGEETWVLDLKTPYVFVCNVSFNSLVIITATKNWEQEVQKQEAKLYILHPYVLYF